MFRAIRMETFFLDFLPNNNRLKEVKLVGIKEDNQQLKILTGITSLWFRLKIDKYWLQRRGISKSCWRIMPISLMTNIIRMKVNLISDNNSRKWNWVMMLILDCNSGLVNYSNKQGRMMFSLMLIILLKWKFKIRIQFHKICFKWIMLYMMEAIAILISLKSKLKAL